MFLCAGAGEGVVAAQDLVFLPLISVGGQISMDGALLLALVTCVSCLHFWDPETKIKEEFFLKSNKEKYSESMH